MMRPLFLSGLGLMLALASGAAMGQSFSAVEEAHDASGHTMRGKLYMADGKVRIEPPPPPGALQDQTFTLIDLPQDTATIVLPARKTFFRQPQPSAQRSIAPFEVGASPCAPPAANGPAVDCEDLGPETVNGRATEKWQLKTVAQGRALQSTIWVDPALHIVVKSEASVAGQPVGGLELTDIVMGPQPASLFEIPAGFTEALPQPRQAPPR